MEPLLPAGCVCCEPSTSRPKARAAPLRSLLRPREGEASRGFRVFHGEGRGMVPKRAPHPIEPEPFTARGGKARSDAYLGSAQLKRCHLQL